MAANIQSTNDKFCLTQMKLTLSELVSLSFHFDFLISKSATVAIHDPEHIHNVRSWKLQRKLLKSVLDPQG